MQKISRTVFYSGCMSLLASCAALPTSNIPGLSVSPVLIGDEVAVSDIMKAVSCQISYGNLLTEKLKGTPTYKESETAQLFEYQGGTGSFSGTITTKHSNGADVGTSLILAGLPAAVTGVPSSVTPGAEGSLSRETSREDVLNFSIKPKIQRAYDKECADLNVAVSGNSISDILVSHFVSTVEAAKGSETNTFNLRSVKTKLKFTVEKSVVLSAGATTFPAAPYTINILPNVSASRTRTGVYELEFTLPTQYSDTDPSRRLIYCSGNGFDQLCDEGPFSEKEKQRLLGKINEPRTDTKTSDNGTAQELTIITTPHPRIVTLPASREGPAF
ncbi:MAG: hypothetical protein RIE06_22895 [Roseibium album]|uniref:hypothetical protein n=1 Tax=Roseibium album TaxID=311410 RepID=UPI0032EEC0B1